MDANGVEGRASVCKLGAELLAFIVAPLALIVTPDSSLIFFEEGDEPPGDAVSFLFLSSFGVADRGTGDFPRSFLEPVIKNAFVKSLSSRSGSSDSLSELLELLSSPPRRTQYTSYATK